MSKEYFGYDPLSPNYVALVYLLNAARKVVRDNKVDYHIDHQIDELEKALEYYNPSEEKVPL